MLKRQAPLNALRAFEVSARTGSFANAARELGVSSAAVSQQVKHLEAFWGKTLFIRQGNRIALSDAGQTAYPQLGKWMTALADLSDTMRQTERRRRLVLSAPHSVAETWLAPRLAGLSATDLNASLDIRVEDDPIDFVRDKVDMRIFYGHDLYGEYKVERLFSDALVAVASPEFVAANGPSLEHVADRDLIHTDWGRDYSTSPSWGRVFTKGRVINHSAGLRVQASSTALRFARLGFGAALTPRRFADEELSQGRLVLLAMEPIPMNQDYLVAYPKRLAANPVLRSVIQVLAA